MIFPPIRIYYWVAHITKDMLIEDLLDEYPQAVQIFLRMGLPCLVCGEPFWGTIEQLAEKYDTDPERLLQRLNEDLDGLRA